MLVLVGLVGCAGDGPVIEPTELVPVDSPQVELRSLWRATIGDARVRRFAPWVGSERVVLASVDGRVSARSRGTGQPVWSIDLDTKLASGVSGDGQALYVATEEGELIALSLAEGEELWRVAQSSEILVPVSVASGVIAVRSADGRLAVLDATDGTERWSWSYSLPALTINGYSRPLLASGGLLLGLDDGRLLALSLENGRKLWESVLSVPSGRTEIERLVDLDADLRTDGRGIFAVNYQGKIARLEPARGQIQWSQPFSSTAGLALVGQRVVAVNDEDVLVAFDAESGARLWRTESLRGRRLSAPAAIDDSLLVVGDLEGYLHLIDADDGRIIGRYRVAEAPIVSEPLYTRGDLYVQAANGTTRRLEIRRLKAP